MTLKLITIEMPQFNTSGSKGVNLKLQNYNTIRILNHTYLTLLLVNIKMPQFNTSGSKGVILNLWHSRRNCSYYT